MNVAVVGASDKPHRYSYRAVKLLKEKGYEAYPVHGKITDIEGLLVYPTMNDIQVSLDTITLYVNAGISTMLGDDILAQKPRRIIFNPGAENPTLEKKAKENGILTINACTLVMLNTGQF